MVQFDLGAALNVAIGGGLSAVVAWHFFRRATADLKEAEDKILREK